jgi:hypothetical protein
MSIAAGTDATVLEQNKNLPVGYPDWWIPVLLIPFANSVDYYLFYPEVHFNGYFLLTFISDLIQGIAGWYVARKVILWLDAHYTWLVFPIKRLVFQLIGTTVFGIGTISLLNEIDYAWLRQRAIDKSGFYSFDLLIIFIWTLVINGIYVSLFFYQLYWEKLRSNTPEAAKTESTGSDRSTFIVKLGKQDIRLDWDEMLLFYIEQQTVLLLTTSQKKYVIDFSLDFLETQLDSNRFFRANRQCILTRSAVKSITKEEDGKLLVNLREDTGFSDPIRMSRLRAPAFKKWLKAE